MAKIEFTAQQAVSALLDDIASARLDPEDWTVDGPISDGREQGFVTTFTGRVVGHDVVLRRLRTAGDGTPSSSDFRYSVFVVHDGKQVDSAKTDRIGDEVGRVVAAVERDCSQRSPIVNNQKFTRHVISVLSERLGRNELPASDWEVEGPNRSGGPRDVSVSYTAALGKAEVILTRDTVDRDGAPGGPIFSITVRRGERVIGRLTEVAPDGPLAKVVARVAGIDGARVAELQAQTRAEISGI